MTGPPESTASEASALASTTGWRTVGRATLVASVIPPASPSTLARAVGPSSHGRCHIRWSSADRIV
jgi:hypothetical protein